MRRWGWILIGMVLAGCGATPIATAIVTVSPTANISGTATRTAELAQIATLTASHTSSAAEPLTPTALVAASPLIPPTPTDSPQTPTDTPLPATAIPTATMLGIARNVVTAQGSDPINVRAGADPNSPVIALVGPGADVVVAGESVPGDHGSSWVYVKVTGGSGDIRLGYIRADLVGPQHTTTAAIPTPIFLATPPPPTPTYRPTPTPSGTGDIYVDYPLIDAGDVVKRPEYYMGKRFSVIGRIFNVRELNGFTSFQIRAETSRDATVVISVGFGGVSTNLQDDFYLRAGGVGAGTFTGTNGFGATIGQPLLNASWIADPTYARSVPEATATGAAYAGYHATGTAQSRAGDALVATLGASIDATETASAKPPVRAATPSPSNASPKSTVKP